MYRLSIKNSQSEFVNTGMLFQSTYYVDNYYKSTGIETCCFSTAISGTSDALTNGGKINQTTIAYACKNNSSIKGTPLKASGLIYKQSARDRYGRADNLSDETRLYPYSNREDKAIGFLKKGVVEISHISNMQSINNASTHHVYRTYDKVLNGTVTVNPLEDIVQFSDVSVVADLKYGDKVDIDNVTYWIISINVTLGQVTINTIIDAGVTAVEITALSQIEDPIFLNNEPIITSSAKGVFGDSSNFPWTTVPTSNPNELMQVVGYVESPIAVRIDINNCHEELSIVSGTDTLVDLTDTNIVAPVNTEVLTYDSGTSKWINAPGGSGTLVNLTDTNIVTPADNEVLRYDSGAGEWINSPDDLPVPSLTEEVEQATHGFAQNDVLAHDGTSYILADVTDEEIIIIGMVSEVIDVNNFVIARIGYIQNSGLTALLATVDADNILYLGLNGGLVAKSDVSIDILNKIPILKKIESDKAEILTSTQYFGFKNSVNVSTVYFGYPGNGDIVEGSWKVELDGSLLKYYRYEASIWILKTTLGASLITDSFVLEDSAGQIAFTRPDNSRKTLIKPSIDTFGAVLGNPDGRVGFVSHGEHTLAYPKTENPVWVTDNVGVGTYTPMDTYYEESAIITNDEIMYKVRIYASTAAYKFRFALLNSLDDSVLLQNMTQSEYDLETEIAPLIVGENTIDLKYPIAFTKGLNIRVTLQTPTNTSLETGLDGKSANSIYRKFADLGTMNYSMKWRYDTDFVEGDVIHLEAHDTGYELSKVGRYRALVDHTAGFSFDIDFANGKWEKIREGGYSDSEIKIRYENNANTNEFSDAEKAKLAGLSGGHYLGVFADYTALITAYPTANDGDTATVTDPSSNLFFWDGDSWEDSGTGYLGDMLKSVYDPTAIGGDAFSMDNMIETTTKKIFTNLERIKLAGIEPLAEVNNMSDIYVSDLTDMGDTTLHYHSDDRDRSNHTGTQLASTISDFDIEVSSNANVAANTAKVSFPEAPINGREYIRKDGNWSIITGGGSEDTEWILSTDGFTTVSIVYTGTQLEVSTSGTLEPIVTGGTTPVVSYTLESGVLPTWMTLDSVTGILSYDAPENPETHVFSISANTPVGKGQAYSLTIEVSAGNGISEFTNSDSIYAGLRLSLSGYSIDKIFLKNSLTAKTTSTGNGTLIDANNSIYSTDNGDGTWDYLISPSGYSYWMLYKNSSTDPSSLTIGQSTDLKTTLSYTLVCPFSDDIIVDGITYPSDQSDTHYLTAFNHLSLGNDSSLDGFMADNTTWSYGFTLVDAIPRDSLGRIMFARDGRNWLGFYLGHNDIYTNMIYGNGSNRSYDGEDSAFGSEIAAGSKIHVSCVNGAVKIYVDDIQKFSYSVGYYWDSDSSVNSLDVLFGKGVESNAVQQYTTGYHGLWQGKISDMWIANGTANTSNVANGITHSWGLSEITGKTFAPTTGSINIIGKK